MKVVIGKATDNFMRLRELIDNIENKLVRQFMGYFVNGCMATITYYVIFITLIEVIGFKPVPASPFAFLGGAIVGFLLNSKFVFPESNNIEVKRSQKITFIKYLVMSGSGMVLNTSLLSLFLKILPLHYLISQAIATVMVMFWNFSWSKIWVFKEKK